MRAPSLTSAAAPGWQPIVFVVRRKAIIRRSIAPTQRKRTERTPSSGGPASVPRVQPFERIERFFGRLLVGRDVRRGKWRRRNPLVLRIGSGSVPICAARSGLWLGRKLLQKTGEMV